VLALVGAALWTLRDNLPSILAVARSTRPRWALVALASGVTLLTYVLPLGEAPEGLELSPQADIEDASAPVLDFYLSGAKLARRGDKVRVVLDKRELPLITDWKPLPLKRAARAGAHKITIDLLDRRGTKVKNAVNRTDRVFVSP